jgi:ornithine carrier protein
MVAELFEFPFDLAKVRLQAQVLSLANKGSGFAYNGPLHCLHRTWAEEGFRGLYRVCLFRFDYRS